MYDLNRLNLILASKSPRRIALLKQIPRLVVAVFPPICDEVFDETLPAEQAAVALAERKVNNVFVRLYEQSVQSNDITVRTTQTECLGSLKKAVILGADTMVVTSGGKILGKPKNNFEATEMFKCLCGTTHNVITGYCLRSKTKIIKNYTKTRVTFGAFNDKIVYNYIKSGASFDKAGGYGIQDKSILPLIVKIDGDKNNVIGLPVCDIRKNLKEFF